MGVSVGVGVGGENIRHGPLRTLMQAHEELVRIRPKGDASLAVWLGYYQRSVALYDPNPRVRGATRLRG